MDPAEYYLTTLTTAVSKLGPLVLFVLGGYFIFIKLPFLFFRKSMTDQKKAMEIDKKEGPPKIERVSVRPKEEKKQEPKQESKQEQKEAPKRPEPKPRPSKVPTPEEVLGLKPGEGMSKAELKKRYFELLKQNHPDRVASMGKDFQKLAEKNTKDINDAYEKLLKKAS